MMARDKEKHATASRKWYQRNPAKTLLYTMRKNARVRGYECTITLEELDALLVPMTCALTGWKLRWDVSNIWDPLAPSPDRRDSRFGYVSGNVRIVAWSINRMRGDMTDEELRRACRAILAEDSL